MIADQTRVRLVSSRAQTDGAYAALGVTQRADRGSLGVHLVSCAAQSAPGVRISLSPEPEGAVYDYNAHGTSALDPLSDRTPDGFPNIAAVANVPPGSYALEARQVDADVLVSRVRSLIRAGAVTYVRLVPSPVP